MKRSALCTSGPGTGHCAFNAAPHVAAVNALDQ